MAPDISQTVICGQKDFDLMEVKNTNTRFFASYIYIFYFVSGVVQ
jgi:hypothetical protein